jgi:hypothetical protein
MIALIQGRDQIDVAYGKRSFLISNRWLDHARHDPLT